MKRNLVMLSVLCALSLPLLAQRRLSPPDQQRFDSYYSRWQDYQQRGDRDETVSMQRRMLDIYAHYGIPPQTPFWRVASNMAPQRQRWHRRLNPNDQSRFDSYFARWRQYRVTNNRSEVASMEQRMQDVYAQYHIPSNTPYWWVASNAGDRDHW